MPVIDQNVLVYNRRGTMNPKDLTRERYGGNLRKLSPEQFQEMIQGNEASKKVAATAQQRSFNFNINDLTDQQNENQEDGGDRKLTLSPITHLKSPKALKQTLKNTSGKANTFIVIKDPMNKTGSLKIPAHQGPADKTKQPTATQQSLESSTYYYLEYDSLDREEYDDETTTNNKTSKKVGKKGSNMNAQEGSQPMIYETDENNTFAIYDKEQNQVTIIQEEEDEGDESGSDKMQMKTLGDSQANLPVDNEKINTLLEEKRYNQSSLQFGIEAVQFYSGHQNNVKRNIQNLNNQLNVTCDKKAIHFWKIKNGKHIKTLKMTEIAKNHTQITAFGFSHKYRLYALMSSDFKMYMINEKENVVQMIDMSEIRLVSFIEFFDQQDQIILGSMDGVFIFDFAYQGKYKPTLAAQVDPFGKYIYCELKNRRVVEQSVIWVKGMKIDYKNDFIISWSQTDMSVNVLSGAKQGKQIISLKDLVVVENQIQDVVINLELRYILTSTKLGQILIWKYNNNKRLMHTFEGHIKSVVSMSFLVQEPELLVSASLDGTLKIWSLDNLQMLYSLDTGINIQYVNLLNNANEVMWQENEAITVSKIHLIIKNFLHLESTVSNLSLGFKNIEDQHNNMPAFSISLSTDNTAYIMHEQKKIKCVMYPPPKAQKIQQVIYSPKLDRVITLLSNSAICFYQCDKDTALLERVQEQRELKDSEEKPSTYQKIVSIDLFQTYEKSAVPPFDRETINFQAHRDSVFEVLKDHNLYQEYIVFGMSKGSIVFVNTSLINQVYCRFTPHREAVRMVRYLPKNNCFVSICDEFNLKVWRLDNEDPHYTPLHSYFIHRKINFITLLDYDRDEEQFKMRQEKERIKQEEYDRANTKEIDPALIPKVYDFEIHDETTANLEKFYEEINSTVKSQSTVYMTAKQRKQEQLKLAAQKKQQSKKDILEAEEQKRIEEEAELEKQRLESELKEQLKDTNQTSLVTSHMEDRHKRDNPLKFTDRFVVGFESGDQEIFEYNSVDKEFYRVETEKSKDHSMMLTGQDFNRKLGIIVSSCMGGKVRIWNSDKKFLREILFPHKVDAACFKNSEGDILVSHEKRISIIKYQTYYNELFDELMETNYTLDKFACSDAIFLVLKKKDDLHRDKVTQIPRKFITSQAVKEEIVAEKLLYNKRVDSPMTKTAKDLYSNIEDVNVTRKRFEDILKDESAQFKKRMEINQQEHQKLAEEQLKFNQNLSLNYPPQEKYDNYKEYKDQKEFHATLSALPPIKKLIKPIKPLKGVSYLNTTGAYFEMEQKKNKNINVTRRTITEHRISSNIMNHNKPIIENDYSSLNLGPIHDTKKNTFRSAHSVKNSLNGQNKDLASHFGAGAGPAGKSQLSRKSKRNMKIEPLNPNLIGSIQNSQSSHYQFQTQKYEGSKWTTQPWAETSKKAYALPGKTKSKRGIQKSVTKEPAVVDDMLNQTQTNASFYNKNNQSVIQNEMIPISYSIYTPHQNKSVNRVSKNDSVGTFKGDPNKDDGTQLSTNKPMADQKVQQRGSPVPNQNTSRQNFDLKAGSVMQEPSQIAQKMLQSQNSSIISKTQNSTMNQSASQGFKHTITNSPNQSYQHYVNSQVTPNSKHLKGNHMKHISLQQQLHNTSFNQGQSFHGKHNQNDLENKTFDVSQSPSNLPYQTSIQQNTTHLQHEHSHESTLFIQPSPQYQIKNNLSPKLKMLSNQGSGRLNHHQGQVNKSKGLSLPRRIEAPLTQRNPFQMNQQNAQGSIQGPSNISQQYQQSNMGSVHDYISPMSISQRKNPSVFKQSPNKKQPPQSGEKIKEHHNAQKQGFSFQDKMVSGKKGGVGGPGQGSAQRPESMISDVKESPLGGRSPLMFNSKFNDQQ